MFFNQWIMIKRISLQEFGFVFKKNLVFKTIKQSVKVHTIKGVLLLSKIFCKLFFISLYISQSISHGVTQSITFLGSRDAKKVCFSKKIERVNSELRQLGGEIGGSRYTKKQCTIL